MFASGVLASMLQIEAELKGAILFFGPHFMGMEGFTFL